ncbi:hypothetical protein FIU87_16035 [Bacillus sp. THAF10]|uniref:hypothetical protein n=1 Tax=Bacillus sp. THAF10 TaxID=2587848 RepID=UPI0012A9AA04|nr:hypothetical protein [Bacillus sp. THAF10]QFT90175.1 hypothetical protein FIU87_16035 [Bacillus sp. THAF10]
MKNRLLLAMLCIAAMLYIAIPRLPLAADGLAGLFALAWILLAIMAVGGNIAALLYLPKRKRVIQKVKLAEAKRARLRQYQ